MIIKYPDPKLSQVCDSCTYQEGKRIGDVLKKEIAKAIKEAKDKDMIVVGLAAPQVGINKQVFIAFDRVFINPHIVKIDCRKIKSREGCLSLGNKIYKCERDDEVCLRWQDVNREMNTAIFDGHAAVIIQHEMDHLNGILCNKTIEKRKDAEPSEPRSN